jgi:pimeloyl-ACP methyl ester carboxylesterase
MPLKNVFLGSLLALAVIAPTWSHAAQAPRLYDDSTLVTRDRFSDEIVGSGPDLVFIPGLTAARATWKATADRLKAHHRLHLIQIAGFAGEPVRGNASGEVLVPAAEAIDAYLAEQHLTPATLIGHSLGGTMALYLAEHHGDHLKKILLVDALPFFGVTMGGPSATIDSVKPMADMFRASTQPAPNPDQMIARFVTAPADRALVVGWGAASDPGTVNRAIADDLTLDMRPGLAAIAVPVTLLYPDNVPNGAPPGAVDAMYQAIFAPMPHKTLIRIDNARHFIMLDQPAQFDAALDAFLKN